MLYILYVTVTDTEITLMQVQTVVTLLKVREASSNILMNNE